MRIHWLSLILLPLLVLTSCAPSKAQPLPSGPRKVTSRELSPVFTENPLSLSNTSPPQETPSNPLAEPTPITPVPSSVVEDGLQKKLTQLAIDDLAARLNINAEGISAISVESTVWLDAALGCPTDQVYGPGKVHGFRIRLKARGQVYVYHTDNVSQIILCLKTEPAEPGLR